ncbi:MAG TPA: hypothetical protein DDZ92_13130 [Halomonas sp.]|nr:hypothetical protein [Halomonas sp.]|tara:strand:- start:424 stop:930 length:507 start_codon:yes stop_codon:yes gene_type:complete
MPPHRPVRYPRTKLLLLFVIFAAPIVTAWGMVTWHVGIPQAHTAHGQVTLDVPSLHEWPLTLPAPASERWTLVFDCGAHCEQKQDELWRLHRALGREAPRLQRLRIGGEATALPGETVTSWQRSPAWGDASSVWLFDPMGRPALAFDDATAAADILDDIRHLFKVNPL